MGRLAGILITVAGLVVAGCGSSSTEEAEGGRPTVVTGFYPLAEAAGRVGGERFETVNLTPAGAEPHDLELTSRQVDQLEDADLVVYLGRGFQPAVEQVVERRRGAKLDALAGLPPEQGTNDVDPHFWLDPVLMVTLVDRIEAALAELRPGDRAELAGNAESYRRELRALHGEYQTGLAACQRKDLVTSHAAFGYLARRYGLTQEPITGLSPESEPDPARLARLTDLVRRRGVTTIFYETLVSPRVAETLARQTGAKTAVLDPIEGLTGEAARAGASYVSVMGDNLRALRPALGC